MRPEAGAWQQTSRHAALGYEQARDELIDVVRRLEAGGTTLEESLALWERGEELAKVCRRWLEGARGPAGRGAGGGGRAADEPAAGTRTAGGVSSTAGKSRLRV